MTLVKYKLGDLINQRREKYDGKEELPIVGVSRDGFIPPKQIEADISIYNQFYLNDFVYNPARMELNSIAFNDKYDKAICSSLYEMFYVVRTDLVIPEYLKLIVKRDEFARHCEFLGSGSAREYCRFANISEIDVFLPSIDEQKKIVRQYKTIEDRIGILKMINSKIETCVELQYKNKVLNNSTGKMRIEEIGRFIRGKNITSDQMIPGEYEVISAGLLPSGSHSQWNVEPVSITISGSGVNAGYFSLHFDKIWAADCSFCDDSKYPFFLYESLKSVNDKIEELKDGHTAQPHVYPKNINDLVVDKLNTDILDEFENTAKRYYHLFSNNLSEIKTMNSILKLITQKVGN